MDTTEEKVALGPRRQPTVWTVRTVYCAVSVVVPPAVHVLREGQTAIGRAGDVGIALPGDSKASRRHALLQLAGGALSVTDGASRNGTFVNGRKVSEAALADGDVLTIGDSCLVVRREEASADPDVALPGLLGVSPAMRALRRALRQTAKSPATVLLLAATGCGKEVAAHALHEASGRPGPFVAVNCSAIPASLAESQLFGHVAGAFTGAAARPGLFRAAEGGTLFLDEIGDLALELQPKLLRALQERAVLPVGATRPVPCDVRIVAATNRDLASAVQRDEFRGDLYARLSEVCLGIPELRHRREDILLLFAQALDPQQRMPPDLAEALLLYPWPFNVRELLAVAQLLRLRAEGRELTLELVADRLRAPAAEEASPESAAPRAAAPPPDRAALLSLLQAHGGNIAEVARAAGRSRKQVYRWLAEHGLDPRRSRS